MRKLLLVIALVILSESCRSIPSPDRSITFEQCSPFFAFTSTGDIDAAESACFCRDYKRSLGFQGAVGVVRDMPIAHCNKLVGSPPEEYKQDVMFLESLRYDLSQSVRGR